ncbi:EF-hand domain-containing protein [Falsiroseomonas oryzae]|uniref:EF-hand domain-containing protein n=1 Tax=Falsiroseomonas oryzae TaxID=2766473 RepID=UPI0022EAE58C|nr:EF-hand domain-containing protein [Roseomonas sp. MO-31]
MKTSRIALLAGAALIAGGAFALPALAQPGPGAGPGGHHRGGGGFAAGEAFARADTNNDSRVSRDEGWTWLQARFVEIDANRDGGVTIEEFRAYARTRMGGRTPPAEAQQRAEQRGQGMFRALDANGDGRISLEEIRPFAEAMFRARDTNSDGFLSREEAMPRRVGYHGHHHGPGYGGPGTGPGMMGPGGERRGPPPAAQPPAGQSN